MSKTGERKMNFILHSPVFYMQIRMRTFYDGTFITLPP